MVKDMGNKNTNGTRKVHKVEMNYNEAKVYSCIVSYAKENNMTPTYTEIAELVDMSVSGVWSIVENLVQKRLLKKEQGKSRSITVKKLKYVEVQEDVHQEK